jgi:superfamily II DNA or RNA helicase
MLERQQVNTVSIHQAQKLIRDAIGKNKDEQTQAIKEAIRKLYPYYPRQGQTQALTQLVYFRKDLILIAQTSFGKSMILQAVSLLLAKSITLIIIPLDRIGIQQTKYIEDQRPDLM